MTNLKSAYLFVPWARRGLSNFISPEATATRNIHLRPEVVINLDINQNVNAVTNNIELFGPGDIAGIDPQAVIRTDPKNGAMNVEPNYLACMEFYDEDFPWRYTPLAPSASTQNRLNPWLHLIVLEENEFKLKTASSTSLPGLQLTSDVKPDQIFPDSNETWAWAHVHLNTFQAPNPEDAFYFPQEDISNAVGKIDSRLKIEPNLGISRLLCPRVLSSKKKYQAFLIPAYESGRRAGLNIELDNEVLIDSPSWNLNDADQEFPYYYTWSFETGEEGDFESLIAKLKAEQVDPEVGRRKINIQQPGWGIEQVEPREVLLEGALLPPIEKQKVHLPDLTENVSDDFSSKINEILNFKQDPQSGDPVIQPPLYGGIHANVQRLELSLPNFWLTALNRDPRNRIAAGLGSMVIQKHQETLMAKAWEQVSDLREVNDLIDRNHFARIVHENMYQRRVEPRSLESLLQISEKLHAKLRGNAGTIHAAIKQSKVPAQFLSAQFKKLTRPGGSIQKKMAAGVVSQELTFLTALNKDKIKLFSPSSCANLNTISQIHASILASKPTASSKTNITKLKAVLNSPVLSKALLEVATLPSGFAYKGIKLTAKTSSQTISSEGSRFKKALLEFAAILEETEINHPPVRDPLNLEEVNRDLRKGLDPNNTYSNKMQNMLGEFAQTERIMLAPEIRDPMFKPLRDTSFEFIIPNIDLINYNSITIMRSNQAYIEAYMLGLNQEFGKELLWRSYPTDQRGTYFRQFWETVEHSEFTTEDLKDINPVHTWPVKKNLGHNAPAKHPDNQLILVINGDLLKRYPNAVIYLQEPEWDEIDQRLILPDFEKENPNPPKIKEPVLKSDISDSFSLIGFNISVEDARGKMTNNDQDSWQAIGKNIKDAGWYVVIKQVPGEPRFGIDLNKSKKNESWDDLDYSDFKKIPAILSPSVRPFFPSSDSTDEVNTIPWGGNSANMAFALQQKPFKIAIPARIMIAALDTENEN